MPRRKKDRKDPAWEAIQVAWQRVVSHPLFAPMVHWASAPYRSDACPPDGWATINSNGRIVTHPTRRATPEEWTWVFAHLLIHLGLGHGSRDRPAPDPAASAACDVVVNRYLDSLKLGRPVVPMPPSYPGSDEEALARLWRHSGVPPEYDGLGVAGRQSDVLIERWHGLGDPPDWSERFAAGLSAAAAAAVDVAGGARSSLSDSRGGRDPWDLALAWFVSSYPLLGAIASSMTVVAEAELARGWDIQVAAVNAAAGEIYVNPLIDLTQNEWRFVMAHEMLHAALRHGERVGWRDPYLWNVAADLVINGWLLEMGVGTMPEDALHDPALKGLSVETVYDRITTDLRRYRKLATLRGVGLSDVLGHPLPRAGESHRGTGLDDIYRRALSTGLAYHDPGRGLLPAGLVEEIRALDHPALGWDAQLARWFEEHVPAVSRVRTYARASRRQSGTPNIPRPGWIRPVNVERLPTYGVVLDTSGSMDRVLLGKALGAIASYSLARDVPAARVVFCDAAAYDAGYVPVEEIAGRVQVRGRGGTVLQPGVDLLERADDFPVDGPVLLITDGECDVVRVRREHAWLVPAGASLPFRPRGPVFRVE
ncbi:vWA domain-containing protein [Kribbella swartbergensis]